MTREGTITRRGKASWRIKYELPRDRMGKRRTAYKTVRGKRADAERELRAILSQIDKGIVVEPSKVTVAEYLDNWLDNVAAQDLGAKTLERYRGLAKNQIKPHLGTILLQKLTSRDVSGWVQGLRTEGKLSARSIRHAHGVLRTALTYAAGPDQELLPRNVAVGITLPKLEGNKVQVIEETRIAETLSLLEGHSLFPIVAVAIGTGARRGEIAALRWSDLDLDKGTVRIERALEQTKGRIEPKAPKTKAGYRTLSLPAFSIEALRAHRRKQLEIRMALGAGPLPGEHPVFGDVEGNWPNPYSISDRWRDAVKNRGLPKVVFHSLRHTHASALIAAGLDVVSVSKRLGHASPTITLSVYAHMFANKDDEAAAAIDAALGNGK